MEICQSLADEELVVAFEGLDGDVGSTQFGIGGDEVVHDLDGAEAGAEVPIGEIA